MRMQDGWPRAAGPFWQTAIGKFPFKQLGTLKATPPLLDGDAELNVWGGRLECEPGGAAVVGRYDDGAPAVLLNKHGKGEALLIGALVGESYARAYYGKLPGQNGWKREAGDGARRLVRVLLANADVERPAVVSAPGFYASVLQSQSGAAVFLNGATPRSEGLKSLTLRLRGLGKASSVETAFRGTLKAQQQGEETVVTLPAPDGDSYVEILVPKP
jgi:hypothetical protein